jgi:hypothetical protein
VVIKILFIGASGEGKAIPADGMTGCFDDLTEILANQKHSCGRLSPTK